MDRLTLEQAEYRERLRPRHWSEFSISTACNYHVKGLLEPEQHIEIFGESGKGKTFVSLYLAVAIASGRASWFGMKVRKTTVIYIYSEGGQNSFAKRIAAIQEDLKIRPDECDLHVITVSPNFGIEHSEDAKIIREHIKAIAGGKSCAIFNDTVAKSMHGQSEDRSEGMGCYISNARSFTIEGHSFVSIHHTGKNAERGSRGSYALPADVDGLVCIEDGVISIHKARDGADGARFGFELEQVRLGDDDEGDPITTCIVRELDEVPEKSKGTTLSDKQKRGLEALQEALIEMGKPAPDKTHYPAGATVVHVDQWRDMCQRRGVFEGLKNERDGWKKLHEGLASKRVIAQWDNYVWIARG